MDKTITTEDFRNQPDNILKDVQGGVSYTITDHGRAVARIVPSDADQIDAQRAARQRLLEHLDRQPARNLGPWSRDEAYR